MLKQHRKNSFHINKLAMIPSLVLILVSSLILSSCLQTETGTSTSSSSQPPATPSPTDPATSVDLGFAGVGAVENIDGSTIKVSWTTATNPTVAAYRVYEVAANGELTALIQLQSSFLTFYHTGLIEGTYHSYVVKAVNSSMQTDTNFVVKTGLAYSGIAGASITGNSTATITFNPTGPATLGANIYGIARGQTFLLGTVSNTASSFNATTLKSGVTYQFKVNALTTAGTEDTNVARITDQTTPLSATRYKGPLLVQAYGDSIGAPAGTPVGRNVSLTWLPFTSATTSTTYKVVRVRKGGVIDTTTTTSCTSTTIASCNVVCAAGSTSLTGSKARTCNDLNIDIPPESYDYVVVLVPTADWPEELPASDSAYRITVPIPPNDMVLVHRASANYEQCQLMGKTSDPLNNQRCAISGASMLGATPYNTNPIASPLNLPTTHYDFGYNLFVDRWTAACNWTPIAGTYSGQSNNGMCGAGATASHCFGNVSPSNTIGIPGNVYYDTAGGLCWVKKANNTWASGYDGSLTSSERLSMVTNNPAEQGGFRPPFTFIDQVRSNQTCNAITDPTYGPKRLLRHREFIAAAAWPSLTGEPGALTDTEIANTEAAAAVSPHTAGGGYQCNSVNSKDFAATAFRASNTAGDIGDVIKSFNIGSVETSRCVSRFGLQDHVGNVWQWQSDQMSCSNISHTCSGIQSAVDAGNGFASGFDMNGFQFNGIQGPGSTLAGQTGPNYTTEWTIGSGSFGAANFNTTLGLPMVGNDNGNAISVAANTTKLHNDYFWLYTENGSSRGLLAGGVWGNGTFNGRWTSNWNNTPTTLSSLIGFRCALPAE